MYFSKSIGGFYLATIHGDNVPTDSVEITADYHENLMQEQARGKQIIGDDNGYPIAIDPPEQVRTVTSLQAEIAAKRWEVETSGITVAATPIKTDRESQSQLSIAYASLKNGLIADTQLKAADGSFTTVTLNSLEPITKAIATHVRACFAAEQSHNDAITLLQTQEELDSYDINDGWPPNSY